MLFSCEIHPEKRGWLLLTYEGEPLKELSTAIYGKRPPLPKELSSKEELLSALKELERKGAKRYLAGKLAKRGYHTAELKELLKMKEVDQETIDSAISEFVRLGYLNDAEWVDNFVAAEQRKKRGPDWIEAKLKHKKIPPEEIRRAIDATKDDEEMRNQISRLLKTRYRNRNLLDYREREKTIGALIRRGYEINMVREVIRFSSQMD